MRNHSMHGHPAALFFFLVHELHAEFRLCHLTRGEIIGLPVFQAPRNIEGRPTYLLWCILDPAQLRGAQPRIQGMFILWCRLGT
ncbi:hypothetical protein DFP73DRAFT_566312 [Morchella snyderi]|nr:hypothetical protein DFP73DRAFT_566312 [Morchella snyderi]